jgi:hypothetical protein
MGELIHLPTVEPYLTKRELARHLRCSVGTVKNRMRAGMPRHSNGHLVLFRLSEVEPWLDEQSRRAG